MKLPETPKWKVVGAAAAIAGLGVGGVFGAALGSNGNDDPVTPISLQDRIAVRGGPSSSVPGAANEAGDSLSSPLDSQSVNSVNSVRSAASPATAPSAASPASPASVASAPAPARATAPAPAPARATPAPAPRVVSFDSPASAPSAPSAASPASVDSP